MYTTWSDHQHSAAAVEAEASFDAASLLFLQRTLQNALAPPESKYYSIEIESFCKLTSIDAACASLDVKKEPKDYIDAEMLSPFYRGLAPERESMVTARRYIEAILDRPDDNSPSSTGTLKQSPNTTVFLSSNTIEAIKDMNFKTCDRSCSWHRRCHGISLFSMAPPPSSREDEAQELRFECLQYEKTTKKHRPEHYGHMSEINTNVEVFPETLDRAIVWVTCFIRNTTLIFGESFILLSVLRDILSVVRDDPWVRQEFTPRQIMTLVWRIHMGIRQGMMERKLYILQRIQKDLHLHVETNWGPLPDDVQAPMARAIATLRRKRKKRRNGWPTVDPDPEMAAANLTEHEDTKPAAVTTTTTITTTNTDIRNTAQSSDQQGQGSPTSLLHKAVMKALANIQEARSNYSRHQIELFCRLTGGLDTNQSPDEVYGEKDLSPFYQGLGPEKECMVTARDYVENTFSPEGLLLSSNTIEAIKDMIFDTYDRSFSWDRRFDGISLFSMAPPSPSLCDSASVVHDLCVRLEKTIRNHEPKDAMRMARLATNVVVFPDTISRAADWVDSFMQTTTRIFGDGFILLPLLRNIRRLIFWQALTPMLVMTLVWKIHTGIRQAMTGKTLQILLSIYDNLLLQTLPDFGSLPINIQAQIRIAVAKGSESTGHGGGGGGGDIANYRRRSRKRRRRR